VQSRKKIGTPAPGKDQRGTGGFSPAAVVQSKLTLGSPDDAYEREAGAIATSTSPSIALRSI
jgi:hypothetical protein